MRQFATGLNRAWLAVTGIVVLVAGLLAVAVGTGLLATMTGGGPRRDDATVGASATSWSAHTSAVVGVGLVGVLLALLGGAWLLAQVPRVNSAAVFRLRDAATGLTSCDPSVLADAAATDAQALPGVTGAAAVLRGTAAQPELTLRVTAHDRTDIPALLTSVRAVVAANLETAMGASLHLLAVQVDISPERRTSDSVTL